MADDEVKGCIGWNIRALVLVLLFLNHLSMLLVASKHSPSRMISGYKPKEEVDILHRRGKYE